MALLERHQADRCLTYGDRTWQQFQLIRAGFANAPDVHLFYSNQRRDPEAGTTPL